MTDCQLQSGALFVDQKFTLHSSKQETQKTDNPPYPPWYVHSLEREATVQGCAEVCRCNDCKVEIRERVFLMRARILGMDNNTYEDPAVTSVLFQVFLGSGSRQPLGLPEDGFWPLVSGLYRGSLAQQRMEDSQSCLEQIGVTFETRRRWPRSD